MKFQDRPEIDRQLVAKGVENLREFGYPKASVDDITTDSVYAKFFRSMLEDNIGHRGDIDDAINRLIEEIDTNLGEPA